MCGNFESAFYAVSPWDSVFSLHSFSIPGSDFQDAEDQCGGAYFVSAEKISSVGELTCIALDCSANFNADAIRVGAGCCAFYRVVEEKVSGFVTVVRRSFSRFRQKAHAVFKAWRTRYSVVPLRRVVLANSGGLRL
jgi:hypothetical protein